MEEKEMNKNMVIFMAALLFSCAGIAGAASVGSMEDSIEVNQTGSEECMAGTLYMQSLCSIADGDIDKCLNLMFLYGIPCLIFGSIMGDAEINWGTCLVGYFSISTVCLSCNGDVLKCLGLTLATFYFPCLSRAWSGDNESLSE
jgi:hypothetical protein